MTRRRIWLLVLLIVALAIYFEPTFRVRGLIQGEPFYQGYPATFWRNELRQWEGRRVGMLHGGPMEMPSTHFFEFSRKSFFAQKELEWLISFPEPRWPTLLDGDPAALAVLEELLHDSSVHVRKLAKTGIERINGDRNRGPGVSWDSHSWNWEQSWETMK